MSSDYSSTTLKAYGEIDDCAGRYLDERPLKIHPYGHIASQLSDRMNGTRARMGKLIGRPVVTPEISESLKKIVDDVRAFSEHGGPGFEESTLVIGDSKQLSMKGPGRDVTWAGLWNQALREKRILPHVKKYTDNGTPLVIGYETISGDDTNEPLQAELRYTGPDELGQYVETLFKKILPKLVAYEEVMRRYELREAKESLMAGVKGAIPYVIGGIVGDILSKILLDPTGQTYKALRKMFEVPVRYIQGNSDTFQQFLYVRRKRKQENSEVDKTYQAVRAGLIASSAGPIAMIGLPLLGVDITTWQYFIAVTLAASADNLFQALTKARANYLEAKDKGLIGANKDDPTVSGNLFGTISIAFIDLVLRALTEATGTNSVLGHLTSIAGESGVLGPFDSEVAALLTSRRQNKMRQSWALVFGEERLANLGREIPNL